MQRFKARFSIFVIIASFAIASCGSIEQSKIEQSHIEESSSITSTTKEEGTPLYEFVPLIEDLEEEQIESVSYQVIKNEYEGLYSFCDPVANYENDGQEDIHRVYEFLKKCRVCEYKGTYSTYEREPPVVFTIHFKTQTKLECVVNPGRCVDYFYSETHIYHLKQMPKNVNSYTVLTLPLPTFNNFVGYSYSEGVLDLLDIFNKDTRTYASANWKALTKMVFVDDIFVLTSDLNDYNKYIFRNRNYGYLIFENSKQFRVVHDQSSVFGDYGHFRIINDVSFEDFHLQDV